MLNWTSYLRWMLATSLAMTLAVGAFNFLIDPLGVTGVSPISGVNARKPYLDHHRTLSRWLAAVRACPKSGIFGNSRAEIGFNPEHPQFVKRGGSMNHAIPGSGLLTAYHQLSWLHEARCAPTTIVLGVDFMDFLGGTPLAGGRLPETPEPPRLDVRAVAEVVFSITGLRDSISTVLLQNSPYAATISPRGFNSLDNYIPEVVAHGHYDLFRQRAQEALRTWRRKQPRISPVEGGISEDQAVLEAFLSRAGADGATVHLVIYPYHAQYRMLLERLGLGELFIDWKRAMAETAHRFSRQGAEVVLWDFSAITPETSEQIPVKGDRRTHMRYYWEAGHFKSSLGDLMIEQMLGDGTGFGVQLRAGNGDASWGDDRRRLQALLTHPSPLLAEVDELIRQTAK